MHRPRSPAAANDLWGARQQQMQHQIQKQQRQQRQLAREQRLLQEQSQQQQARLPLFAGLHVTESAPQLQNNESLVPVSTEKLDVASCSTSETYPAPTGLPHGWSAHFDPSSGHYYFQNDATYETQWEVPQHQPMRIATPEPEMRHTVQLAPIMQQVGLQQFAQYPQKQFSQFPQSQPRPRLQQQPQLTEQAKKKERKQLSKLSKTMALNKDYIALAQEAQKQQKYRHYKIFGTNVDCVICHKQRCTEVFFPCQHLCACSGCIHEHNIGVRDRPEKAAWRQCPLCNADIKKVARLTGKEDQAYWNWVHEIQPPLPKGFKKRFVAADVLFTERAKSPQKTANNAATENETPGELLHGWGSQTGNTQTNEEDEVDAEVVVKVKQHGGCCIVS